MKNKLFIFMILSLMLVSLSAVCAEDTASLNLNETYTATINSVSCQNNEVELVENTLSENDMDFNNLTMSNAKEITNEPNTGDKIYVNPINGDDNNNGSNWDNSVKTINKALTLVNDNGFIYLAEGEHTTPATINKNVKLIGQNQEKTILTNSNNCFLTITSNNVGIYNTTFKNNKQAIKINGKDGNKYYINNCSFIKNTANSEGGAIYITKGNLTINNSNFINNTATESGGAIYMEDNGNLTINNSNFINNTATEYHGGAIYIYNGNLTINNSNFINNTATEYHGGAININSGNINITDSTLINNTASVGGAISISGSGNINMTDSTLINNSATDYGGAIYANKGNHVINNSNLINNTASSAAGAISINRGNLNMTDSTLINNKATEYGGAIHISYGNLNINNSNFINNTATGNYGYGGAIYMNNGNLNINNSNFINNTATENGGAIHISDDENIDIDGNWWGSNNPDWNSLIDGASAPKSFVVLDVSINEIGSNIYNVIANLYLNGTQTISNIPTRNITFKCGSEIITGKIINGTYNKTYTLDVGDKKEVTVSVDNEIQNIALIGKQIPNITIKLSDIVYGEDGTITVILPDDINGKLTIYVDNMSNEVDIINGAAQLTVSGLNAGTHNISAVFAGNQQYAYANSTATLNVAKTTPTLNVAINDIRYGEIFEITATLTGVNNTKLTGNVTVTVNNKQYTVEVVNGIGSLAGVELPAGSYNFNATWNGDNNYNLIEYSGNFNIAKTTPTLNVIINDIRYGEKFQITATLTGVNNTKLTGNVTVTVNNKQYTVEVVNGKGTLTGVELPIGNYQFTATWNGDNNYNSTAYSGSFNVDKAIPDLNVVIDDVIYGDVFNIDVTLTGVNNTKLTGNVTVTVNNNQYIVEVVDGEGTLTGVELPIGNYQFTATWNGDDSYDSAACSGSFNVAKLNATMDVIIPKDIKAGDDIIIMVNIPEDATGEVSVEIDGKTYTATLIKGSANITIPALTGGDYNVTVTYNGDEKYNSVTKTETINVINNRNVNLNVTDIVMIYHDGTRLIAILTDYMGNPIANAKIYFTINGVTYNRTTDATGNASMALNLNSGIYNASILFNGSDMYDKASKNITVTIKSTISGQNIVKFYQNGTQFFATFIDTQGNILANTNVTFNINGVFYTRKTNENGTARLAINLRPGEYILTAINPNNTEQKGFSITVKSLIEADDLTKYFQNASRFEAKIYNKDGSLATNTNVTFNINGVFYTRTTNNEGVVSLAINLRPGTYTITTIYDGLSMGNTVKVLPTLETNDLSMKFRDGSKFQAKTVDGQGNPLANQTVTFNVNGVFYHKVTGNDGVASLNINLNPGEYIITSIWNNYQVGNNITIA